MFGNKWERSIKWGSDSSRGSDQNCRRCCDNNTTSLENMRLLDKVNSLKKQTETLQIRLRQSEERNAKLQQEKRAIEMQFTEPPAFPHLAECLSKRLRLPDCFRNPVLHRPSAGLDSPSANVAEDVDWLSAAIRCPEFVSDVEQLLDTTICVVCVQRVKGVLFSACRHFAICTQCSSQLQTCPICRTESEKINVFSN
jgi:hypothetical protein